MSRMRQVFRGSTPFLFLLSIEESARFWILVKKIRFVFLASLLLVCTDVYSAINTKNWIELRSENLTMLTDLSIERAAERLRDLELFREVVLKVTNLGLQKDVVPSYIYVFAKHKDFSRTTDSHVAGYFKSNLRANVMVFSEKAKGYKSNVVMYHEYVHSLLRDSKTVYPEWYDEGLAEMLSTVRVKDNMVIIGRELRDRIHNLAVSFPISLSRTVNQDDLWRQNNRLITSYIYSLSWATVNYMYTGWVKGRPNYSKYIPAYIGLINDGMDRNEAFIHAFGITPARMERETFRYLKLRNRGLITYPIDQFKYHGDITTKALTEEKASYELGYLLAPANPKAARELFEALLKKQPTNKRILSGLAVTYQMEGEWKTGLRFAADALDDEDYLTHLEYADMLVVYCASRDAPKNCDEQYQIALKHYNKVLQLEPKNVEGKFGAAKCLSNLNLALDEALEHVTVVYDRMPYNSDLNYWRGHIHFQLEDYENAKIFLEKASTWSHNKKIHEKIKSDMLHINPGYAQAKH